jgi:uncharacterized protein YggE
MRIPMLVAALSTVLATAGAAQSAQPRATADAPVLSVRGEADVRLPPDVAVLRIAVASRASTAAAAAAETGRRVRAVADTLRRSGLGPEIVQPLALNVASNEAVAEGRLVDYEARATISVRVRQFDRLGALIDAALGAGATEIPSVRFESDSMDAAERSALARAYTNALSTGRALAAAAGLRLGRVLQIETFGAGDRWHLDDDLDLPGLRLGTSARREVRVEAAVTVRWQLVAGPR